MADESGRALWGFDSKEVYVGDYGVHLLDGSLKTGSEIGEHINAMHGTAAEIWVVGDFGAALRKTR
jgi:hypothetical protein